MAAKVPEGKSHTSLLMDSQLHEDLKIYSVISKTDMRDIIEDSVRAYLTAHKDPSLAAAIKEAGSFAGAISKIMK